MPDLPLISFCIATMNRPDTIGETLATIAGQIDGAVEIVIVDGSAGDATERVVEDWRSRLPALRYERRPPQGIDRDYARTLELARGEYCWTFTDDDWLLPGALAAVRRALAAGPDCVVANFEYRNPAMREVLLANYLGFDEDRSYAPGEFAAFAHDTLFAASFIASLVVRRSLWAARDGTEFYGTEFAHVARIYQAPIPGRMAAVGRRCIAARLGVSEWSKRGFRIWAIDWPRIVWSLPGLDDATREKATAREPWRSVKRLVRLRAIGSFSAADYDRWLRPQPLGGRLRAAAWVLSRLPPGLVGTLALAYVRRFRPHIGLYRAELEGATQMRREARRR